MKNVIIRDEKGRDIIKINDHFRMVIARFPDLSPEMREYIIDFYTEATGEDSKRIKDFLDYKSSDNEFCV